MSVIVLDNQLLDNVLWKSTELCDFKISDRVDIWQIDISANLLYADAFLKVLNPEEIKRADKYFNRTDGDRSIISRGALRHVLAKYLNYPAAEIEFKLSENGKPVIDHPAGSQINFNLSDSAGRILIAIARSAVGIDVELIKTNFMYDEILNNNFSEQEIYYIKQDDSSKRFFLLWTRKEAILKATGIGLTDHLSLIPSLSGINPVDGNLLTTRTNWQINSFETDKNYIASIASNPSVKSFAFFKFDFNKL